MRAVAASPLDVHRDDDVGPQHADQANVVASDFVAPPLVDHFLGIERVAVIDRAREVLLRAVDAMRRQQLGGAQHAEVAEELGADLVLTAFAAVVLHVDRSQPHTVCEQREQRVGLVVGMCRHLHERARHIELSDGEAERHVSVLR